MAYWKAPYHVLSETTTQLDFVFLYQLKVPYRMCFGELPYDDEEMRGCGADSTSVGLMYYISFGTIGALAFQNIAIRKLSVPTSSIFV